MTGKCKPGHGPYGNFCTEHRRDVVGAGMCKVGVEDKRAKFRAQLEAMELVARERSMLECAAMLDWVLRADFEVVPVFSVRSGDMVELWAQVARGVDFRHPEPCLRRASQAEGVECTCGTLRTE